jgi:cysteine-rich repeat protein
VPVEGSSHDLNAAPRIGDFVVLAQNSVHIQNSGVVVGGDIGAIGRGSGPFLSGGVAVDLLASVQSPANKSIIADSIQLAKNVSVGSVQTNRLVAVKTAHYASSSALVPLPVLPTATTVTAGTTALTVKAGTTKTVSPGVFAAVKVAASATWRLGAGAYDMTSLTLGSAARVEALGKVTLRISGHLDMAANTYLGPAAGTTLTAGDVRVEVSGVNGTSGGLAETPVVAAIGATSSVVGLFLVPNGSLTIAKDTTATGAFMARDVDIKGASVTLTFQDGFAGCGNGALEAGEQCDDGNLAGGDGCSPTCQFEVCGDGVVDRTIQKLTYRWLGRACNLGSTPEVIFTLNEVDVARAPLAKTCSDEPGIGSIEVTDPALLALGKNGVNVFRARTEGEISWASVIIQTRTGGGEELIWASQWDIPTWPPTNMATFGSQIGLAGSGLATGLDGGENCDDGNTVDGDACPSTCVIDKCAGVICPAPTDACHDPGVCDSFTGVCSNPPKDDGTSCDDGNGCTQTDQCQAGACAGSNPVACPGRANCQNAGTCDPASGQCSAPTGCAGCGNGGVEQGEQCDDGNVAAGDGCSPTCQYERCGDGVADRTIQTLKFHWLAESCNTNASQPHYIRFTISDMGGSNDIQVARVRLPETCSCTPGIGTVEVTDPLLLSLGTDGTNVFRAMTDGTIAWASVEYSTRNGGGEDTIWTANWNDYNDRSANLCAYTAQTGLDGSGIATALSGGETCDDGNTVSGDGCSATCQNEYCGDGIVMHPIQKLVFHWLGRSCGDTQATIGFTISDWSNMISTPDGPVPTDVEIARVPLANSCGCSPGAGSVEVTNPTLLAYGRNGVNIFRATTDGDISWASVEVQTLSTGGDYTIWTMDQNNENARPTDMCSFGFQSELPGSGLAMGIGEGENCDDGNTVSGDGCSSTCMIE